MGEVLKGWRRKFGSVTLVMACVLMGGWMRSCLFQDTFTFTPQSGSQIQLVSASQHLLIAKIDVDPQSNYLSRQMRFWTSRRIDDLGGWLFTSVGNKPIPKPMIYLGFRGHGFWINRDVYDWGGKPFSFATLHVPYWSIVVPLTFISLWLLLSKSRKSAQQKIVERTNAKEA